MLSTAFKPEKNMLCLMEKIHVQEGLSSGVSPVAVAAAFGARESRRQQQQQLRTEQPRPSPRAALAF